MYKELKKSLLYSKFKIEWRTTAGRLKSYNNSNNIAVFVFDKWDDWFEKEWVKVPYQHILEFIW